MGSGAGNLSRWRAATSNSMSHPARPYGSANSAAEQALLLADILNGVPDKLARVQTALKPVAQSKNVALSVDERGVVEQACTALQFAISDIVAVLAVAREAIGNLRVGQQAIVALAHEQRTRA
jgi:hypothetical protein